MLLSWKTFNTDNGGKLTDYASAAGQYCIPTKICIQSDDRVNLSYYLTSYTSTTLKGAEITWLRWPVDKSAHHYYPLNRLELQLRYSWYSKRQKSMHLSPQF